MESPPLVVGQMPQPAVGRVSANFVFQRAPTIGALAAMTELPFSVTVHTAVAGAGAVSRAPAWNW